MKLNTKERHATTKLKRREMQFTISQRKLKPCKKKNEPTEARDAEKRGEDALEDTGGAGKENQESRGKGKLHHKKKQEGKNERLEGRGKEGEKMIKK